MACRRDAVSSILPMVLEKIAESLCGGLVRRLAIVCKACLGGWMESAIQQELAGSSGMPNELSRCGVHRAAEQNRSKTFWIRPNVSFE
jgi:hypothetical protein